MIKKQGSTYLNGGYMKKIAILFLLFCLTSCGTVGGLVSGAGTDMQKAGEWIKKK